MRITLTLSVTLLLALVPAVAHADTTWIGGDGEDWHDGNKWNNGVPDANDVVTITNGTAPEIDSSATAYAKSLNIDNSGSGVTILAGATLVLGDGSARTSNLDNANNEVTVAGTLKISGEHTFTGNGTIRMTADATSIIEEATDLDDLLILETECGASPIEQACSMTLIGQGEVKVALDNRAFVIADHGNYLGDEGLRLTTRPKTTDDEAEGYWKAVDNGILWVQSVVTGPGEWHVKYDDAVCATIIVGHEDFSTDGCVLGTGKVILTARPNSCPGVNHTLKVLEHTFCTTGRLVWESVSDGGGGWTRPAIRVDDGATAKFGLSDVCPATDCGS